MTSKIGRGKKLLVQKGLASAKSEQSATPPLKVGRGKFVMSPTQEIKKAENVVEEKKEIVGGQFEDHDLIESQEISSQEESSQPDEEQSQESSLMESDGDSVADKKNAPSPGTFLTKKDDVLTENQKAEKEWKTYQCERKITKILKDVNDENLNLVVNALETLVEERPLSSHYTNCSEIKKLIEVLLQKTVEKEDFLRFGPCLLKMIAEHSMVEFVKYFPDIADEKRQEYITLCASDDLLSASGQRFCKLFGHLFSMPRQTSDKFFNLISVFVEECVEKWTYPDGSGGINDGTSEGLACVYGIALRNLLLEISEKMLPCDTMIQKRMEKYCWYIRESILNGKISRKIREVFIETYVQLQSSSGDSSSSCQQVTTTDIETSECGSEYDDVVIESEEVIANEQNAVLPRDSITNASDMLKSSEPVSVNPKEQTLKSERDTKEDAAYLSDPYICIKYLLYRTESDELLSQFVDNEIKDCILKTGNLKMQLKDAGLPSFFSFQFHMMFSKLGFEKTQQSAIDYAKNLQNGGDVDDTSESNNENKVDRPRSRMAMNFEIKTDDKEEEEDREWDDKGKEDEKFEDNISDISHEVTVEQVVKKNFIIEQREVTESVSQVCKTMPSESIESEAVDFSSDSDSDIIIEDEYSDVENQDENYLVQRKPEEIIILNKSPVVEDTNKMMSKLTLGRGRGMVQLSSKQFEKKPTANVQPLRNETGETNTWREGQSMRNDNANWRNQASKSARPNQSPKNFDQHNNKTTRNYNDKSNKRLYNPKTKNTNNYNRNSSNNHTKSSGQKFKPQYHPKPSLNDNNETNEMKPTTGFSSRGRPQCTKCESFGHIASNCNTSNPFF